ncbi:MAG TPA: ATP-binding protein [Solirubrobacteraceae bacterium]|jgi:anti-sigma regulatory factor (Ser/Thr protein kinase)|nr:ATP-binding protein [Solirubrobacteraceae bacterium]
MWADVLALDLPMTAAAPGLARRAVERLDLEDAARDSARLLASELVTNALLHSGVGPTGSIRVSGRIAGDTLRLSVTDDGTGSTDVEPRTDPGIDGGFGLLLVDQLAARWGVERGARTTVWCELPVRRRQPALG